MQSALKATALIAVFSILSKILGAAKAAVLANRFGAGIEIDIYFAAFRIPDLMFNLLILGTLSAAFIPIFVSLVERGEDSALKLASTIFSITALVMAFFGLIGIFFAPLLIDFIVPGFSIEDKAETVKLTRVLFLSPLLFGLSSVLTSILHSYKRFLLAAIAPLFYNLAIIGGVFFLYPKMGLLGLAVGAVAGAFFHFVIQLPSAIKLGLRPFTHVDLRHPSLLRVFKLYLPRLFGVDLGQISLLIATVIGSGLSAGSLAIFYFAFDLNTFPLGVFAISFAIATFPVFSEYVSKNDFSGLRVFFAKITIQILFLIIPISVLILLLRAQIVRLILGAGQNTLFDFSATRSTSQALGFFTLSLFAQSLTPLLARVYYSLQNTIIPVLTGLLSALLNVVLAIFFTKVAGPDTMALAYSIAAIVNMLVLFAILHRRLKGLEDGFLFIRTVKILIASVIMGAVVYITMYLVAPLVDMQTYIGILIQTASAVGIGLGVYLLAGLLIGLPETRGVLKIFRSWFDKFTKPVTSAIVNMFTDLG